ncbi:MarR family transcriptional regulator [Kribbella voronezhensis]|uniref:MarR family transcriptional regulator n=1 Tax=Kribbella voronezhensis TaxID=2512212 RepID=A0A4R7TBS7_9ACTN|nr:MarR family winged helix-turn-helix transcriptional regulator [Kribbella voronezhensis]TDU89504.1 MarR family transcriptional regulator [Kribbella voronezhensis]
MKTSQHRHGDRVIWHLGRASYQSRRLIRRHLADAGAKTQHYHVLASLADDGDATQSALADRIVFDRSDLVTLLDELGDLEYVVRSTDPADRRRNIVAITAKGKAALAEMDKLIYAAELELLAPLSAAERKTLLALLGRLDQE